jgi:methylglutaconyl-CoA hydratase
VKKMLSACAKERLDRDLARAIRWNEKIRNSADFREGLSAFLEKRTPVWPASKHK